MVKLPEETGLIQKYLAPLAGPDGLGLADDAACLSPTPGMDLVITTDTIVENVHFLSADPPFDIAIKAVTVNLSDLVAKGATPVGYQVALTFPQKPDEVWMVEFARGLGEQIAGRLLGGDITVSRGGPLTISVTAIGEVPVGKMVRRNGARVGDDIYVCGPVGTKAAGLKCALDLSWAKQAGLGAVEIRDLVSQYTAPMVVFADLYAATVRDHASAALDISDGLAIDLERLCAASNVGAQIRVDEIPLHPLVRDLVDRQAFSMAEAVTGGDDYVALFTAPPDAAPQIRETVLAKFHRIGKVVEAAKGVTFLNADGSALSLGGRKGYDHFDHH